VWLRDYSLHVLLIGIPTAPLEVIEPVESDPLMDSLSPGVRTSHEGAGLAQAAAVERRK
jgi:hypothetical protein